MLQEEEFFYKNEVHKLILIYDKKIFYIYLFIILFSYEFLFKSLFKLK